MKQKVFSWKDRFSIKNADGTDKYSVEGEFLSFGKKLHIKDANGNEVAFVKQRLLSFLPRFDVEVGGNTVAQIVKEFTLLKPKYAIKGIDWNVEGDFFSHDYVINQGEIIIASIHKQWMSWGDTFEIDIEDENKEVMALAVVLAIDAVMDAAAASTAAASASN
jgi:uncharacterized protein YxjI